MKNKDFYEKIGSSKTLWLPKNDRAYYEESIYVNTKTGEFFLSGKGGLDSRYGGSKKIITLSLDDAFDYLNDRCLLDYIESPLNKDKYELFGKYFEDLS